MVLKKSVKERICDLSIRYLILLLIALPFSGVTILYYLFRPLTIYPLYALLSIFYNVSLVGQTVILIENSLPIELVAACIAGSAYYLLFILNLSIPKIKLKKRVKMILSAFAIFLAINILRIFILSVMAYSPSISLQAFDITHRLFWYALSTIFVVLIWFYEVKHFKIKEIPFYTDIKYLLKQIKKN